MQQPIHKIFNNPPLGLLTIFLLTLISCSTPNPSKRFSDLKAREIIERSIQYHGGMKIFNQLDNFCFEKVFSLYKADGSVEYQRTQLHDYYPSKSTYEVSWKQESKSYKNRQYSNQFSQEINGEPNTSIEASKIKSSVYASVFTIFLPWKLLDIGTNISYDGELILEDGKKVFVVKASYNPKEHKHHTKSDIWWHYFDKATCQHVGYKVTLIDHSSLIRNLDFQTIDGFIFPKTRKSWRVNESNEKDYLRAEYDYKVLSIK